MRNQQSNVKKVRRLEKIMKILWEKQENKKQINQGDKMRIAKKMRNQSIMTRRKRIGHKADIQKAIHL